ncbi:MAG: phosphoglucomutase/phosphomannomutase family protein [Candidatus Omnitrophica bacterium]|nr:phosphoglucomutase/phosphomannomutase family protein [Candidatus Omnitrophota bacterium]
MDIKFGTSGWRAVISEEFTFDNVRLVTQAISDYIKNAKDKTNLVIVGYDTRFLSREFAEASYKVLLNNGLKPLLTDRDTSTPVISFHIIDKKASGAINITASHNPSQYNGIKFSSSSGSPAGREITSYLERRIVFLKKRNWHFKDRKPKDSFEKFQPQERYISHVKNLVNLDLIKRANLKIGIDFLYGTSRGYLDRILEEANVRLYKIHDYINPDFGDISPTPAKAQLKELLNLVKAQKLDIGLSTDPDGDRFGVVDRDGSFIQANEIICVILEHLIKTRKRYDTVARTIATTSLVDKIATSNNMEPVETPVGFKYIAEELLKGNCLMGAEESGGLSIAGHIPEKDGILACLLVLETCASNKKSIKEILKGIAKKYGSFYSERNDIRLASRERFFKKLSRFNPSRIAGLRVLKVNRTDGFKFYLVDGSWLLIRPSGTEPIARLYAESNSKATLKLLLDEAKRLINF